MTIGLLMFVRDEEKALPHCFSSLPKFDQYIIAIDDKTIDNSAIWLKGNGFPFHYYTFINFSESYNLEISKFNTDWILAISPDETINFNPDFIEEGKDCYAFPRVNWYNLEMTERFEPGSIEKDWQIRLFKNNGKIRFQGKVHEQLCGWENIGLHEEIIINHFAFYYEKIEPERLSRKLRFYEELGEVGYRLTKSYL